MMTDVETEAVQADIDELLGVLAMLTRNIRSGFKGRGVAIIVQDAHATLDRLAARCESGS